jgi:hypothetical protein
LRKMRVFWSGQKARPQSLMRSPLDGSFSSELSLGRILPEPIHRYCSAQIRVQIAGITYEFMARR